MKLPLLPIRPALNSDAKSHRLAGRQRRINALRIAVVILFGILIGITLLPQAQQFHPYLMYEPSPGTQIAYLQRNRFQREKCEAKLHSIAAVITGSCPTCRLAEQRCISALDERQQKILYGVDVDLSVMHFSDGSTTFVIATPTTTTTDACPRNNPQIGGARCPLDMAAMLVQPFKDMAENASRNKTPNIYVLIGIALLALIITFLTCFGVIRSKHLHSRFSDDGIDTGPNKFHALPTPRIGGLAIVCALIGCILILQAQEWWYFYALNGLLLAAAPAFASGFGDDITKRVSVLTRLTLTISAGAFASFLAGATLRRVGVPGLDLLLQYPIFAVTFTAFSVGGVANALNLIDGYNGLAAGFSLVVLAALAVVSFQVGDQLVLMGCITMAGALFGFLVWNYPRGSIFLGDGGAYLLGFWLAEMSVLLVARNPEVSPWFPLVLLAYPVFETLFSVYRRLFLRGKHPGHPDALHLHQLIYSRLVRVSVGSHNAQDITRRNSMVARYLWIATALFSVSALAVWRYTPQLMLLALLFSAVYLWLYVRLVRWNAPTWMMISR